VLGRVDAIVFTGGIGENAAAVRAAACSGMEPLGIALDAELNAKTVARREGTVSTRESRTAVLVVPTDEEAAIADDTFSILKQHPCPTP
jgi:acetate kinase